MSGSAFDRFLALKGLDATSFKSNTKMGKSIRRRGVRKSSTIQRILHIPRRTIDDAYVAEAIDLLSEAFGYGTQQLRPLQAISLVELADYGGCLAAIEVGGGKTLVFLLAPVVTQAKRPVLMVPAKLREKTFHEIKAISKHWKVPPLFRAEAVLQHPGNGEIGVISYQMLSRESGSEILQRLNPDLLMGDEIHACKNPSAAVTKRVKRHVTTFRPRVLFASGTIVSRSILDFAHLLEWAIPDMNPTPESYPERLEWSQAIDSKIDPGVRLAAGALEAFWNDEERALGDDVAACRSAFRRRLVETPAVVVTRSQELGTSLSIETVDPWGKDKAMDAIFRQLRATWELPDGQPIADPPSFKRHAIELSLGFWYRWKVQPPIAWLAARSAWAKFSRDILSTNKRNFDSEGQVASACARGEYSRVEYDAWCAVRGEFKPETEAVWVSDHVLKYAEEWGRENSGAIIWVKQIKFGEELAARTGWPYYGAQAKDQKTGKKVFEHEPRGSTIIASVLSVNEGQNLQDAWHSNLITEIDPTSKAYEQAMGRTHREGQEEDEVRVVVLTGCKESFKSFLQAREDARMVEQTIGARQKLVYADVTLGPQGVGPRWE